MVEGDIRSVQAVSTPVESTCKKSESERKRRATKISFSQVMQVRWLFNGLTGLTGSGAGFDFLVNALRFDAIFCN